MSELKVVLTPTIENPNVGDLYLDSTGNEVLETDLAWEVAQRLRVRFEWWLGEWFLDQAEGLPYLQYIFQKFNSERIISAVFRQVILTTEGVASIELFTFSVSRDRRLSIDFTCRLSDGNLFRFTDYAPFIVDVNQAAS